MLAEVSCALWGPIRPNVVLITIDTLRADRLSLHGYRVRQTPNIDRLGRQGIVFEAARCDVTWTTPSMASTMTGTFAPRHGVRSPYDRLTEDNVTVAELLRGHGYRTGAVVASYPVDSIYGLNQGFEVYDDTFSAPLVTGGSRPPQPVESRRFDNLKDQQYMDALKAYGYSMRPDHQQTDAALAMLEDLRKTPGRPFFLWVHYFGPHDTRDLKTDPLENLQRHARSYPDKVVGTDRQVGRFLAALDASGLGRRTLVILHADHGESLGEHDYIGHGRYLFEDNLRVPLILRWPGKVPEGGRSQLLVGNVDIAPTILEAAGITDGRERMDGRSLLGVIRGDGPVHETLYAETYLPAGHPWFAETARTPDGREIKVGVRRVGVLSPPWKYVATEPQPILGYPDDVPPDIAKQFETGQLYNLTLDPAKTAANSDQAATERLRMALAAFRDQAGRTAGKVVNSDEHVRKLRSLGYVR